MRLTFDLHFPAARVSSKSHLRLFLFLAGLVEACSKLRVLLLRGSLVLQGIPTLFTKETAFKSPFKTCISTLSSPSRIILTT